MAEVESDKNPIDGRFVIEPGRKLVGAAGPLPAFGVRDLRAGSSQGGTAQLMAVQVADHAPPRAAAISRLTQLSSAGVLLPVAHGPAPGADGRERYYIVCAAPPGPALNATQASWTDATLIEQVVRPVASALAQLEANGVTHRAIRPDNLFRVGAGQPAVLGAAWAAPPASHQPAVFEPPYIAMCAPAARGAGSSADDVYALGVTLIALAAGRVPLAGLSDADILRRKIELGSFEAIAGEQTLPPLIADLARGMLAEDPLHRPTPAGLTDTSAVRGRRVALRPTRRAPRPLQVASIAAGDARGLAYAMAVHPEEGLRLLRAGAVGHWLREMLRDVTLANRIDEALRQRGGGQRGGGQRGGGRSESGREGAAGSTLAMHVIALLDPLAPLCWHGLALWPDGIGPLLAIEPRRPEVAAKLHELIEDEAVAVWAGIRPGRCDLAELRRLGGELRRPAERNTRLTQLAYELNPLLPCASPALAGRWVARLRDLLPGLEAVAATPELRRAPPIDDHVAAFIAARRGDRLPGHGAIERLGGRQRGVPDPAEAFRSQLRLLARLQVRLSPPQMLPSLAAWLCEHAGPLLATWRSRRRRDDMQQQLGELAQAGNLPAMVSALDDQAAREADRAGLREATDAVARIDAELELLATGEAARRVRARHIGREVAAGMGLSALTMTLAMMALR